ncbi:MAG: alanine--tRNA ligase [Litorivicinus sp.]
MTSAEIRNAFLQYFRENGHEIIPSSSLVPGNDPTLLFTNAGMVQFKDTFTGQETRAYSRATTSQRCVRAGGKHNDLENVGYTARHHTFFEMLGNFSFGDYFKREAIQFAWTFLTERLGLPEERLWVTVHHSDQEAEDIWLKEMGVSPERFSRLGDKDNFWMMGDTGPCGPSSEIFYDHGDHVPGGPPGSENDDLDRYIEIWNLVFMQFEQAPDGSRTPLPNPSIDTGMGLERIAAIMQGVHSNYEIDLFQALLASARQVTGCELKESHSLQVLADHIRSCSFMIVDGVLPSNEGRGYVLRRIIRRAVRHGNKLGAQGTFFHKMVAELVNQMGEAYPELSAKQADVERVLLAEEEQFIRTLDAGMKVLEDAIDQLSDTTLPGDVIFRLYDTHGFPVDLTADIARERSLELDMDGFEACMQRQREQSRSSGGFAGDLTLDVPGNTEFLGYSELDAQAQVLGIAVDQTLVPQAAEGAEVGVILDRTSFYAESGGQVGDFGELVGEGVRVQITDCRKNGRHHLHLGRVVQGELVSGMALTARVMGERRQATALNHSATHLLHEALRRELGDHVEQKGSLNDPERLRFDFSHPEAVTPEQLRNIEAMVNQEIRANHAVETLVTDMETAIEKGAMALFGEKYGESVRVLSMGEFSVELCGGTHVQRTGDIGLMKITSEGGVSAGVRRIEAVTGANAERVVQASEDHLRQIAGVVKGNASDAVQRVSKMADRVKELEKEVANLKRKLASGAGGDLTAQAVEVAGIKVLAARIDDVDPKTLRDSADQLKNKLGKAIVVLATVVDSKVSLVAGVTKAESATFKAGELIAQVAAQVGGKGGGRPDMAMAGGTDPSGLDAALAGVVAWVESKAG